ncbi:MAG: S8 family serine peptidase [Terriglobales bacterium]
MSQSTRKIRLITSSFLSVPAAKLSSKDAPREIELEETAPPWQAAYEEFLQRDKKEYVEVELRLQLFSRRLPPLRAEHQKSADSGCVEMRQNAVAPGHQRGDWHLFDIFSQLDSARGLARRNNSLQRRVRIAHIDTGYDQHHTALPPSNQILRSLSRDFTQFPPAPFADDTLQGSSRREDYGHGTATLCLLSGGPIEWPKYKGADQERLHSKELGGAPEAEVLPLRISPTAAHTRIDALIRAVQYAIEQNCDVIVMSIGGAASRFLLDVCNLAYEKGIVCIAAAGNHLNIGGVPTVPHSAVYPARFNRVISATGVMADGLPYELPDEMSGNWGPREKIRTTLAAYTPNVPWAEIGCPETVSHNGAGTAAAAQQIAAAAALWLQMHGGEYEQAKTWKRTEAVRQALLRSVKSPGFHDEELGFGILQACDALALGPQSLALVPGAEEPPDAIWFPWLKKMAERGLRQAKAPASALEQMLHVEYAQLEQIDPLLSPKVKSGSNSLSQGERRLVCEYLVEECRLASAQLKRYLKTGEMSAGLPVAAVSAPKSATTEQTARRLPWTSPIPKTRRLRIYALDPSYALQRSTISLSQIALEVPWETDLKPGPVDEYLEVIDCDPSSDCFYEPVDLNDEKLVVQDGLSPSPGNPLFHQQMVYAVARKTIDLFESALGRRIFWTGPPLAIWNKGLLNDKTVELYRNAADDSIFVQRLRIYPHAMRQPNAYYSQRKGALLFGYFPSQDEERFGKEIVYTCLSYDIVAHETTHAILDGMNRTLVFATNPDVLAFHEAFADVIALLSRFQIKEIVASQIASTRGILSSANILGQLGREFGIGTGRQQSLRAYLGRYMEEFQKVTRREPISRYATDEEIEKAVEEIQTARTYHRKTVWEKTVPDPRKLSQAEEAHERGAILVAAIYGALVSIYETRAARLLRLTGASDGAPQTSDLPAELIDLLAEQLTRSATQVLHMCIRAIDYLPPTDITFGDYLRAILTADFDLVPDDRMHYRVAFIESFRDWGIKVDGVQSASEDSLLWQKLNPGPFIVEANELAGLLAKFVQEDFQYTSSRRDSFRVTFKWRWKIRGWLDETFKKSPGFERLFGLSFSKPPSFYVRVLRRVERIGPGGRPMPQALLQITQTRSVEFEEDSSLDEAARSLLREERPFVMGGATLIVNTSNPGIDYVILKNVDSKYREEFATKAALERRQNSLRATYFGPDAEKSEPFALIHQREDDLPWQFKKYPGKKPEKT